MNFKTIHVVCLVIVLHIASACQIKQSEKETGVSYFGKYKAVPANSVEPQGWVKELLQRQRDGLGLHRAESGYPYNTCLWDGVIPLETATSLPNWWPYEQSGYIVDGLYRCGLFLKDSVLEELGRANVNYVISHPRTNGLLGPDCLKENQWAFSVFARTMMSYYEATGDERVLTALTNHVNELPDSLIHRQTCIIESMCWLYSKTQNPEFLQKAENIWREFSCHLAKADNCFNQANMIAGTPINEHGVTVAEVGKQPMILYLYTGDSLFKEEATGFFGSVARDHELVDGIPSSQERLSGKSTTVFHETCDISDFMWSYGYLLMGTGDMSWADKMERSFYNAALGAISKDFRSHQYFSSVNQVIITKESSRVDTNRYGTKKQAYRPGHDPACCSGNVHRMIPNYVSRMWMRDTNNGILAALFGPSCFSAIINNEKVTITQQTNYPFEGEVEFLFDLSKPLTFPFSMRVPAWASDITLRVNGEKTNLQIEENVMVLRRQFKSGDKVLLSFQLPVRTEQVENNGICFLRGPLLFSLPVKEKLVEVVDHHRCSEAFPAYDIYPASVWNYSVSEKEIASIKEQKIQFSGPASFPWDQEVVPLMLSLNVHRVPEWKNDITTPELPQSNFQADDDKEIIKLIPYGATRLRVTIFPVIN